MSLPASGAVNHSGGCPTLSKSVSTGTEPNVPYQLCSCKWRGKATYSLAHLIKALIARTLSKLSNEAWT